MSSNPLSTALKSPCWHLGKLLAFSHLDGPTDYASGLVARTVPGGLDVKLPGECQLRFAGAVETSEIASDSFEARLTGEAPVRGVMLDAHHLLLEGAWRVEAVSPEIATLAREGRLLVGAACRFKPEWLEADFAAALAARRAWLESLELPPALADASAQTRHGFARAAAQMKGQVCSPQGMLRHAWTTPDRWPHRSMWLWDSAFHAIGWRHLDPALARDFIDAVLDAQDEHGFVPHMAAPDGRSEITQPPVLALAAGLVLEKAADPGWLAHVYPKLAAYLDWDAAHRDTDGGGLLEWYIEATPECRSGESGMDNSPRFDAAVPLDAPDFNAFLAHEYEWMAGFAARLGKPGEAAEWSRRHRALCGLINEKLWNEAAGLYCDRDPRTGALSPVLSCAGFLPLLCGAPSAAQARALAAHLKNPRTFGTPLPIPSVAACNTECYSKDMWRGPAWVNINWLVARGLRRYGFDAEAGALRHETLAELERYAEANGTFFEYFDDRREIPPPRLLRKGKNLPGQHPYQAIHDYGWSATLFVDWVAEGR